MNELSKLKNEFKVRDNKKYEVKIIINNAVYSKEAINQIQGLYYFVF